MFNTPLFEFLPIALITASILFMATFHSVFTTLIGFVCIAAACFMMYRRLVDGGTEPDTLE